MINTLVKSSKKSIAPFYIYHPPYTMLEKFERWYAVSRTIFGALKIIFTSRINKSRAAFGASVEITDRCNAGCNYCYVYPTDWDQDRRVAGYLQLSPNEHKKFQDLVYQSLDKLKRQGIVHVTLVGGEPLLASNVIYYAAKKFPVCWVVSNGSAKFPKNLPKSVVMSISIDGPPDLHNQSRDPKGFFSKYKYGNLTGLSAVIIQNINESKRGAFAHITLTRKSMNYFLETVDWLLRDVTKLRGIMVSGAATKSTLDPNTLTLSDRQLIKHMIHTAANKYGWELFPFNQPKVNDFLFDEQHIIQNSGHCSIANRVDSLGFDGNSVGKCVLRDDTACETCVCNLTGLMRGVKALDKPTLAGLYRSCFG
jgi:sulfatase maturation enzyme AslB (radical SAM superfamily)